MSSAQNSRCLALYRQFSRIATASANPVQQSAPSSLGALLLSYSVNNASAGSSGLCSLLREASLTWRAYSAPLLRTHIAAKRFASKSATASRTEGMVMSTGVLSRCAAGPAAAVRAGGGEARPAGGLLSLVRGRAGQRAAWLPRRLSSTAAEAAQPYVARPLLPQQFGGAALSEGLSRGARLSLAAWMGLCSVWVYSMVVLGGITRLTRSGLSMTEWKLTGERPPMTEAEWEAEFEKYKASPEFQKVHRSMNLQEFKFIYWMEYAHRMWGRGLGLVFALPAAFFLTRGWLTGAMKRRLLLLFCMGGTQGLVGWWMVRSGLEEPEHAWATPRVSPYRLAAHLVSAFTIFATLVWTTLDLVYPRPATAEAGAAVLRATAGARRGLTHLAALIAITASSGAFVAGMDAGRAYNTWPLMGGRVVPEEYWDEQLGLSPLRNMFENTAAVQFNHRTLATVTLLSVGACWLRYRGPALPARATTCLHAVGAFTAAQFLLGVVTLLYYVPVPLGSAHQANALNLFTAALALMHACRPPAPSRLVAAVAPYGAYAASAAVVLTGVEVARQNGGAVRSGTYTGPSAVAMSGGEK